MCFLSIKMKILYENICIDILSIIINLFFRLITFKNILWRNQEKCPCDFTKYVYLLLRGLWTAVY